MAKVEQGKYEEFQALRQEILINQKARLTILMGSVAFVGAVLSCLVSSKIICKWQLPSSLLLVLIGCVSLICFHWGRSSARIGAYIEVFLENPDSGLGWEKRRRNFLDVSALGDLNKILGLIFFILALLSIIIPSQIIKVEKTNATTFSNKEKIIITIVILFTLASIINLVFRSYPRQKYVEIWKKLKIEEESGNS